LIYLESSAVLRALIEGEAELGVAIAAADMTFASALTFLECSRALTRVSMEGKQPRSLLRRAAQILVELRASTRVLALVPEVLERAREVMPVEPVRSLDAIHLATALLVRDELGPLAIASTDRRIRENAQALGFEVMPAALLH
jgi:predicted nucleic acid-binding protein